jgi:transposase
VAGRLGLGADVVRSWLKRFNAEGVDGLRDRPRSGRPTTYTPEQVGEVIAVSLTNPETLGLPFACWTLDRLAAYLNEERGLPIKRTRIDELLVAEGLRWRQQETWFGERVDPAFVEKRGPSSASIRPHLQVVR